LVVKTAFVMNFGLQRRAISANFNLKQL